MLFLKMIKIVYKRLFMNAELTCIQLDIWGMFVYVIVIFQ